MLLAFFGKRGPLLTFYGFVPVAALGWDGNNRGRPWLRDCCLGCFQQTRPNFLVGAIFASVAVFTGLQSSSSPGAPLGSRRREAAPTPRLMVTPAARNGTSAFAPTHAGRGEHDRRGRCCPLSWCCSLSASRSPLFGGGYWGRESQTRRLRLLGVWCRASIWSSGFLPASSRFGWVSLLTLGAYTTSVLVAG